MSMKDQYTEAEQRGDFGGFGGFSKAPPLTTAAEEETESAGRHDHLYCVITLTLLGCSSTATTSTSNIWEGGHHVSKLEAFLQQETTIQHRT